MRRDQQACRVILEAVGLTPPECLYPRVVTGQRRYLGTGERPDLFVQVGTGPRAWRALIECKVDAPASRRQIEAYRSLEPRVALLAPEKTIDGLGEDWEGVATGSWQDISARLRRQAQAQDPEGRPRLLGEVLGLLASFGLAELPEPSPEQLQVAAQALARLGDLVPLMRSAIQALVDTDLRYADQDDQHARTAVWYDVNGTNVGWESDKPPVKGFPLEGLGLTADISPSARDLLEWNLWVYPSSRVRKKRRGLIESGAWQESDRWWRLPLGDSTDPFAPLREQLTATVLHARRWLAQDLGVAVPTATPALAAGGAAPVPSIIHAIQTTNDHARALQGWSKQTLTLIERALVERGVAARRTRRGRQRLRIPAVGPVGLEVETWAQLSADGVHLGCHIGFGGVRRNARVVPRWLALAWPAGLIVRRGERRRGTLDLLVDLQAQPIRPACQRLAVALAEAVIADRSALNSMV